MIPVETALAHLFELTTPLGTEQVPLIAAAGRYLAQDVAATRDQPPFPASAMDGYAIVSGSPGDVLRVIGQSAAGHGYQGAVSTGQAVRIFTGAPVPMGAKRVVIQEDVARQDDRIVLGHRLDQSDNIRPAGNDFTKGAGMQAGKRLAPNDIALLAAMNVGQVPVTRRPKVALISTGDELVMPSEQPGPDQIIASNTFGLHALLAQMGALPRLLPIARDNAASLKTVLDLVDDSDLVITIGGASVGDHDLVAPVAAELGMARAFHKVAMRPGKPLMSGRLGGAVMIGLPGNPVSAMVCGHVFVAPVIRAMLGQKAQPAARLQAPLAAAIGPNGPRAHYMRATLNADGLTVFERQDSSLLSVLGAANALVVRPPNDPKRAAGDTMDYLPI